MASKARAGGMTAITRSQSHQYSHEDFGPVPGVTGIIKLQEALGGSDGLLNWAARIVLAEQERTYAQTQDWEAARLRAMAAKDEPMNTGSAVHIAVDNFNRGLPLGVNQITAPYIAQYAAWLRNKGIEVLGSEKYVLNKAAGFGGTYDSLCQIDGEIALVDVKTGKAKESQRLQLAGLSLGEIHGDRNEEPERMPKVDVGYILLLRAYEPPELVRHEITDEDRAHFTHLVETFHRIKAWAAQFQPTAIKQLEEAA
jgi:hypothetical protein